MQLQRAVDSPKSALSSQILIERALMYGLTLSLKNEIVKVASKGRVNTVAPGWVRTVRVGLVQ